MNTAVDAVELQIVEGVQGRGEQGVLSYKGGNQILVRHFSRCAYDCTCGNRINIRVERTPTSQNCLTDPTEGPKTRPAVTAGEL